ncbi:hypothetical protein SNOG_08175 [Parastagonospora nodorum SN15]|uniref:Uncharacterized protein n=1 Tax=Phaeosphaeria nodorum (strain SN15 / ATCC MYA-4574 / FGSC 10173) TaxID=321614 RepID=Q0UJ89_PHANO|nr:hypothetical protein SNOG_08175 [Parastagonospora nodorum SN15]EAT84451.1 hypothetical protein SNOG_08175 [Parastagonospora nodorum SN15]
MSGFARHDLRPGNFQSTTAFPESARRQADMWICSFSSLI